MSHDDDLVIPAFPPNIKEIEFHLNMKFDNFDQGYPVFTYFPHIYNPSGFTLPPDLLVHEKIHLRQQEHLTPLLWWKRWLDDTTFRIKEEVEAYAHQLHYFRGIPSKIFRVHKDRFASDLSSPAYGSCISFGVAESRIRNAEKSLVYNEKNNA